MPSGPPDSLPSEHDRIVGVCGLDLEHPQLAAVRLEEQDADVDDEADHREEKDEDRSKTESHPCDPMSPVAHCSVTRAT